jgi:tRNA U34 5-methylaminomethyl-2-thiouridine-forming methyltransferase MnmC
MKNVADFNRLILQETPDGSYTFHHTELNENYHSLYGAKTESQHVYLDQGLSKINKDCISVFEMGFGTGLNALLTWQFSIRNKKSIYFRSIETLPIPPEMLPIPGFIRENQNDIPMWEKIHQAQWEKDVRFDDSFTLCKQQCDLLAYAIDSTFDIIFYDAFSPSIQPELWTESVFKKLYVSLKNGGILVTYSSAGLVKKALLTAGFELERLPGPPGKKHMLRAIKQM